MIEKAHLVIVDGCGMDVRSLLHPKFSDLRIQKMASLKTDMGKIDSACAEIAYLMAFQRVFGEEGRNLYAYGDNNKPYFKYEKYGCLSLAHASGAGACLIAGTGCGCDIEESDRDMTRIEERIRFSDRLEDADALLLWCAKESHVKLTGEGLSRPFSELDFRKDEMCGVSGSRLSFIKSGQIGRFIWACATEKQTEISVEILGAREALFQIK